MPEKVQYTVIRLSSDDLDILRLGGDAFLVHQNKIYGIGIALSVPIPFPRPGSNEDVAQAWREAESEHRELF